MMSIRDYVSEIEIFQRPNVHVRNQEIVNKILNGIVKGGWNKLQVISDFDKTITKQHENGKKHLCTFEMFGKCPSVPDEFREKTIQINSYYMPIETDPNIPSEEKRILMEDWYAASRASLCGLHVPKDEIDNIAENISLSLRNGTHELFRTLDSRNVPMLVFSAGIGDFVISILKHQEIYFPNIKVISNFLDFDDNNIVQGFQGETIHIFNKNEQILHRDEIDNFSNRENVILMGDSIGDADMAETSHHENVLRIGFLYERMEEHISEYMKHFDIVLTDDQTMDMIRAILELI